MGGYRQVGRGGKVIVFLIDYRKASRDEDNWQRASFEILRTSGMNRDLAYVTMMGARPQAVGYGLTDSPADLAGRMLVQPGFAEWTYGEALRAFTEAVLDVDGY